MDVSINTIDLEYLTNNIYTHHLAIDNSNNDDKYNTELNFYKIRIFKLTKDLLRRKEIDKGIEECFKNYAKMCIAYFQFIDKRDIIQNDYINIKSNDSISVDLLSIEEMNKIMTKKEKNTIDISKLLNLKRINSSNKKIIIPKERNFNLTDPRFKTKGIKEK